MPNRRRSHLLRSLLPTLGVLALACSPALAGGVAIVDHVLSDDGDDDGFADTRETVSMRLTVQNSSGLALSGVTLQLASDSPHVCIVDPQIAVGDLAAGETLLTTQAFQFVVSDVDRGGLGLGPLDDLSARFQVSVLSAPATQPALPDTLALDLDLNVSGGGGPSSFSESFEQTLGAFEVENLGLGQKVWKAFLDHAVALKSRA